ncbi:MAG: TIGR02147 family protein [Deltaproteobacteria bacterium]|nr:TIGR02147 family protein [Deltaproteobacteria bacterium]
MKTDLKVQSFTDYRTFLVAHAQHMKAHKPGWSYGSWARTLGLKNTSSITKILQGTRNPGKQITEQLIHYFRLEHDDADYFRDLIELGKRRHDPRLSVLLMERMSKSHPNGAVRIFDDKSFSVISNWYHLALRELARTGSFLEDADWISKKMRFKVSPREAQQALETLQTLGLLKRDPQGKLVVAENSINTTNDVAGEAIKRYHEQMLDNAKESVRTVGVESRELQAASLVMRKADLPRAKEMIREFRKKFARAFEVEGADDVYQIQVQLFPLTKEGELQ